MTTINEYQAAAGPLPDTYKGWQIHGAGFENFGVGDQPEALQLRDPKDNEIVLRSDAVGLCQSDIKIIAQGNSHARLRGRDLKSEPTVLGHECAVTVVKVGANYKDRFKPGDRFIVQADIYYKGFNYAFGYLIPGGLQQYTYLDERALDGDEGCYLLPVKDETGYSQSALSEPWACVEMSYNVQQRLEPTGESQLIVADDPTPYQKLVPKAKAVPRSLEGLSDEERFDDIFLPQPTPALVSALGTRLNNHGIVFLLGEAAEDGPTTLDIGRIHYQGVRFYGGGADVDAIKRANERYDLLPGGDALFIGSGGPMGQMHVQRAIEVDNRPKRVVVTDLDRARLDHIVDSFGDLAKRQGVELYTFAPSEFPDQAAMDAKIKSIAPGGYSDIIVMAPVAGLVTDSLQFAAGQALVNIFAGVGVGNTAEAPLHALCRGVKLYGTSGSRISDMRKVLDMVEAAQLNTNMSVAAIGGLSAAKEGLKGVKEGWFPGKIVIYPQVLELPLTPIGEIPQQIPELKDKLGPNNIWTNEAEQALLEMYA
ncbi:MAG: alcohol dehydrogenase catalytic domain-containing protein [Candidatus Hydrogenedentota bacterium]